MRISELLSGHTLSEDLGPDQNMSMSQPSAMSMAPSTTSVPGPTPTSSSMGSPAGGTSPNMQMAASNSAPAQMIPNIFGQQATTMMNKTTDRVDGNSTPQLNTGSFFQSIAGKGPIPLK